MNEDKLLNAFSKAIETEFDVYNITILKNNIKLMGNDITQTDHERYLSLTQTAVFRHPENSRFVSRICSGNDVYIIILDSKHRKSFDGLETSYIIAEMKKLAKRLGEIIK